MPPSKNGFSAAQVLLPVGLIALVLFISIAFQTTQIFHDRAILHQVKTQQDKPLEDTHKMQARLDALAAGTLRLAQKGDKNAQGIIDTLKKNGITVNPPKTETPPAESSEHIAMPSKP